MTGLVVDLCAGSGGWSVALHDLGYHHVGIDNDPAACRTAHAAGHQRIRADIASYPPERFAGAVGLVASPPCQSFSQAGRRRGLDDPRGQLVWEPVCWAETIRPGWVCLEQVPEVAPIWRLEAGRLRALGYHTWTGVVDAADFGVPQNRRRAVLVANRLHLVEPPQPTHCEGGRPGGAGLFGATRPLLPWVSMAEALGWGWHEPSRTVAGARQPRWLYEDRDGSHGRVLLTGNNSNIHGRAPEDIEPYERQLDRPAPTVDTKAPGAWRLSTGAHNRANDRSVPRNPGQPAPTVAIGHTLAEWCWTRPATTVSCDERIARPGHHDRQMEGAVRVTIPELAALQGFPPAYPWQGNKTEQGRQVGNTIPPPLAAALIQAATTDAHPDFMPAGIPTEATA